MPIPKVSSSRSRANLLVGHLPPRRSGREQDLYLVSGIGHADLAREIEYVMGGYGAVYYVTGALEGTTTDTFQLALWRDNLIAGERPSLYRKSELLRSSLARQLLAWRLIGLTA
jgi:hypothetical protein